MGRRRALIVANSEYDHSGLSALRSPSADAAALAEVLGDRRISDFQVEVVRNETANVVQEHIEDLFLDGEPDDVLLLHFSCHGVKSESGELYFAARNTRPHRLGSTAVPADFVRRCMRVSRSRSIVLLLDCCYGGAFSEGVSVRAAGDIPVLDSLAGGRGRAVITASNSMEYAFEGDELAEEHATPSVFTSALVRGLSTGEADRDEDGLISLNELYDYVFEQVRQDNPHQTPSRDIEMQGELYLARSGRRRIKPLPMPADLAAATSDPNMFTRLGAVAELRRRLRSANLEVAAGAFEALTEMARTDIANVAGAASEALGDVEVRPSSRELRFSSAEPQVLSLGGPALARACTPTTSEAWIVVSEVSGGWSVSVRRLPSGLSHGRVVFTGPTGEASVTVIAAGVAETVPDQRTSVVPAETVSAETVSAVPDQRAEQQDQASHTEPPAASVRPVTSVPGQRTTPPHTDVTAAAPQVPDPHTSDEPVPMSGPRTSGSLQPAAPDQPTASQERTRAGRADEPRPLAAPAGDDGLARWCAVLALGAAALLLLALPTNYYYGDLISVTRPAMLWYLIPVALTTLVAGVCVTLPGARAAGLGVLVATGSLSSWGLAFLFGDLAANGTAPFEVAFWVELFGLALVSAAAAVAWTVARRTGLTLSGGTDWRGRTVMACGVAVSVLLLVLSGQLVASAGEAVAAADFSQLVGVPPLVLALTAPITPVLVARARSRALAMGLVVTWAVVLAATTGPYFPGFASIASVLWVPLLAAVVVTAVPRPAP